MLGYTLILSVVHRGGISAIPWKSPFRKQRTLATLTMLPLSPMLSPNSEFRDRGQRRRCCRASALPPRSRWPKNFPHTSKWSCQRSAASPSGTSGPAASARAHGVTRGRRHRPAQRVRRLAAPVQTHLSEDPLSGQLFVFRGRARDRTQRVRS